MSSKTLKQIAIKLGKLASDKSDYRQYIRRQLVEQPEATLKILNKYKYKLNESEERILNQYDMKSDPLNTFNRLEESGHKFTQNEIKQFIDALGSVNRAIIRLRFDDGSYKLITLSKANKAKYNLDELLYRRYIDVVEPNLHFGSDKMEEHVGKRITNIRIMDVEDYANSVREASEKSINNYYDNVDRFNLRHKVVRKPASINRRYNEFFPYTNSCDRLDLTRYQIYRKNIDDEIRLQEQDECCFIYTLRQEGISEDMIVNIKNYLGACNQSIPLSKMNKLSNILNRQIVIHTMQAKSENPDVCNQIKLKYGSGDDVIHIGQHNNHFFKYELTKYTSFYIKNMERVHNFPENAKKEIIKTSATHIQKSNGSEYLFVRKPIFIDSLELIFYLDRLKYFTEYTHTDQPSENFKMISNLNNMKNEQDIIILSNSQDVDDASKKKQSLVKQHEKSIKEPKKINYLYGDFESDILTSKDRVHLPMLLGLMNDDNEYKMVKTSDNFSTDILEAILSLTEEDSEVVIWFHNLKYDSSLFSDLFYQNGICEKDNSIYSTKYRGTYCGQNYSFECRDSFKHFGGKLSDSPTTFKFQDKVSKGESIGYSFHTIENIKQPCWVSIEEYKNHVRPDERNLLSDLVKPFQREDGLFDASAYLYEYLYKDVDILKRAMSAYRELIHRITNLDAYRYLTISSIANDFTIKRGCYDGCRKVSGGLRAYIQDSIYGGRVYANAQYKYKSLKQLIEDFDAISLYSSAIKRLCELFGVPIGEIYKAPDNATLDFYESKTWYICRIHITKINKKQQIPCIPLKTKEGLRYINDLPSHPLIMTVDKLTLADYIKMHQIEFDIIDGIYWDQGFNKKLGDLIYELHMERCKHKENNKPLANMIKLIMNSIYGKTTMRPSDEKIVFKSNKQFPTYLKNNFGIIDNIEQNKFNFKICVRTCDESSSLNYIGGAILSMSKTIMNEVFDIANTYKIPLLYTDTDSIHMFQDSIDKLSTEFKKIYNRDLQGKNLGQFHVDFDMKGCENVHSVEFISLAPKVYCDRLEGTIEAGVDKGKKISSIHYRMKGFSSKSIENCANECFKGDIMSLYKYLAIGNTLKMNLNPDFVPSFEFKAGKVSSRVVDSFTRKICFKDACEITEDYFYIFNENEN